MLLVGLTGGLGAGKSTVAGMLAERGATVIDADELARRALEPGTRAYQEVCDLFGDDVVTPSGALDRSAIAERVFRDEGKRRALESITHPEVFRLLAEEIETLRGTNAVVVFDAPLLVETGFHRSTDVVVVVTAREDLQVARAARGRGMTEEEAVARLRAQADPADREAAADIVISNDGDLDQLEARVDQVWEELRRRERERS
jgi:dephospho-CoA kinase